MKLKNVKHNLKKKATLLAGAVSLLALTAVALVAATHLNNETRADMVGAAVERPLTPEQASEKARLFGFLQGKKAHEIRTKLTGKEHNKLRSFLIADAITETRFYADGNKPVPPPAISWLGLTAQAQTPVYEIEITAVNVRDEGGLEVFARAWKDNVPLGFGKDGSVEFERFIIPDPPVLVPEYDGIVDYQRQYAVLDPATETVSTSTSSFKEDPQRALQEMIAQNVKITGKEGTAITPGKVGSTTFGPTYSGVGDGGLGRKTFGGGTDAADWSGEQTATAAQQIDSTSAFLGANFGIGWFYQNNTNRYWLERVIVHFNTADIPDTDTIDSATISAYPQTAGEISNTDNTGSDYIYWCEASPAATSSLTANDYNDICDSVGAPTERTSTIDLSALNGTAYNDFTVNAGGLSQFSKTGWDSWGGRIGDDVTAEPSGTRNVGDWNRVLFESSEEAGTTKDPKLVIEHSAAAGGGTTPTPSPLLIWFLAPLTKQDYV